MTTQIRPSQIQDIPVGTRLTGLTLSDNTIATIVNSAVETTILTGTVPGGTLGTDGALRITLQAAYKNSSGAGRTITINIKYGGTTVLTFTSPSIGSDPSPRSVLCQAVITTDGTTSGQYAIGHIIVILTAASVVADDGTAAIDSTANQTLEITWTHSAAAATISVDVLSVAVEYLSETV